MGDLVERHLPLVRALARRHARRGVAFDDLVQAGSLGLVGAARRYDARRGAFTPYAAATAEGEIRRYLRDRASVVRIPRAERAAAAPVPLAAVDDRESPAARDEIEACEQRAFVDELLGVLSARERAAIALRFRSDLPQREIARRLQLSQSQTSRLLAGALDKLRRSLEAA